MTRRGSITGVLAFALLVTALVAANPAGQAPSPGPAPLVDDDAVRTAWQRGEWVGYGNDPAERRFSPLDQITPANVSRLGVAWAAPAGAGGGNQEATPLAWNGVLYAITNWSIVFALDARTGRELWRHDPGVDRTYTTPGQNRGVCCGVVSRGVALSGDSVIAPVLDGRLIALDARSGTVRWTTRVFPADATGYSITMAPRVAKGKVIVGVAGAEFTPHRGFFSAFDVRDGREAWRFYTVPGDPSKPFENRALEAAAKTWKGEWWKYGGGGSLWDGLSYDPEADLIYVGTGNGTPWPEILRGSEGFDNLYVSSILAVDPDDGELKWHYQAVPGDSWDIDNVQQLVLADVAIDGRPRKVLMQASKGGFVYVLDRLTGEFISATPFAPLNWASGHDPKTGRPSINRQAYYSASQPAVISPAAGGAANWAAEAYSPTTGLMYMPVNGFSSRTYVAIPVELTPGRAVQQNGTPRGGLMPPGVTAAPVTPPYIGPSRDVRGGFLVAFDPATRAERWRIAGGGGSGGGVVATASDLVFQVVPDGRIRALHARDGQVLWQVDTGQRGMGPPITYRVDGRQYVAFMGGAGGRGAVLPPMVYAFALDATTAMPSPGPGR
jgi:PQQ-dependent dehydrogenase (methanol/ethanol family)